MTPEVARTLSAAEQYEWLRQRTSRRSMLRGGQVGASVAVASAGLLNRSASAGEPTKSAVGGAALLSRALRPAGRLFVCPFRLMKTAPESQRS